MTLQLAIKVNVDSAGAVSGAREAEAAIERIGQSSARAATEAANANAAAAQRSSAAIGAAASRGGEQAAKGVKLAGHEIGNLTAQLNDIGVSLASGQSPFMVMVQQGAQVSQVLGNRGLGTLVPALGTALSGLINPTMLAFAGVTALIYAVPAVWRAITGPEARAANDILADFEDLLKRIEKTSKQAADEARKLLNVGDSGVVLQADLSDADRAASRKLASEINRVRELSTSFLRPGDMVMAEPILALQRRFTELGLALSRGKIDVKEFREQLAQIGIDPTANERVRDFASKLRAAADDAFRLQQQLRASEAAADGLAGKMARQNATLDPRSMFRGSPDDLRKRLTEERNKLAELAAAGMPIPTRRPSRESEANPAEAILRQMDEQAERLRTEIALIGQADAVRRSQLATLSAEAQIRARGIDLHSAEADAIRSKARAEAELTAELNRQRGAYDAVKRAGMSAIDDITGAAMDGDIGGMIESVANTLKKSLAELSIANPLKNALYNAGLPTLQDAGGVGGFFKSLFGGGPAQTGTMTVQAATVLVNGNPVGGSIASLFQTNTSFEKLLGLGDKSAPSLSSFQSLTGTPAGGASSPLTFGGNFKAGVDSRLMEILDEASRRFPGGAMAVSGLRPGDSRFHGRGLAADVSLFDAAGRALPNYQHAGSFRAYEQFAQTARQVQMERFPELSERFRWGGYFSGGKGKYGALDSMHFDLGGDRVGMGGGSWRDGLSQAQRALWPGAESVGMGSATKALDGMARASTRASTALAQGGSSIASTATGFARQAEGLAGSMTDGLQDVANSLKAPGGGGGAGGGGGGLFSNLLGSIFSSPSSPFWKPNTSFESLLGVPGFAKGTDYAPGGLAWVGEEGPELRFIPRGARIHSNRESMAMLAAANANSGPSVVINNNTGAQVTTREEPDGRGGRRTIVELDEAVAGVLSGRGSRSNRTLRGMGAAQPLVRR